MKSQSIMVALLGAAMTTLPALAADAPAAGNRPALPGTVNYVEGAASLDGQPLSNKDVGNATLAAGQELSTATGKAEVLLTPGVFLRVDDNTTIKLVSPQLTLTQVQVETGRAGIEVDEIHDQNNLQIIDAGITTRLEKNGYYEFDAGPVNPSVMVFKGEAKAEVADGKWRQIKGGHELALAGGPDGQLARQKPAGFDTHAQDELYNWSSLRSAYLSEANNRIAGDYAAAGFYPGWYWNSYGWGYTFIGADPFYSPFGWGFYPYGWGGWYGGPVGYGGRWGHGPYRYHGYSHGPEPHGFHGQSGFHSGNIGGFHGGASAGAGRR